MALATVRGLQLLNFVVAGQIRSGAALVQSALGNTYRRRVVCHMDLFHPDDSVRRRCHEAYFGPSRDPILLPEWFKPGETNPCRYLSTQVFDNPQHFEQAVGVGILYPQVEQFDLYEFFEERCRAGDFCIVHVLRNPVACLVSLKQALKSGIWRRDARDASVEKIPAPISLDPAELTAFVRKQIAVRGKIRAFCADSCEIEYRDLFHDYRKTMARLVRFLELPATAAAAPGIRRLRNRSIRERISNWATLQCDLPSDVRGVLNSEDLF